MTASLLISSIFRAILKMGNSEDFIRSRLLPFFVNCADDLCILMRNLEAGRYSHVKVCLLRNYTGEVSIGGVEIDRFVLPFSLVFNNNFSVVKAFACLLVKHALLILRIPLFQCIRRYR